MFLKVRHLSKLRAIKLEQDRSLLSEMMP
jgi:hypothetical protein